MFNSVLLVREICKERGIPVAKLEKDCGFSNGYLNAKKQQKIPYERALVVADYLGISVEYILTGKEISAPAVAGKRALGEDMNLTQAELDLIHKFRHLDERGRSAVLHILDHEYTSITGEEAISHPRQA